MKERHEYACSLTAPLSQLERDELTPQQIIDRFKAGNLRFIQGKTEYHDYISQKRQTNIGQHPSTVILSCMDSRAPAEIVMDTAIGETFNCRVAGNIANEDILGCLEYSCQMCGAKVILVMGHTNCGAVHGAVEQIEMGNLTGLLMKLKNAIESTEYDGEHCSTNSDYLDAIAKNSVRVTIAHIRQGSPILEQMEKEGKIKITGCLYHLDGGHIEFMEDI